MLSSKRIAFIGSGNMGEALLGGILTANHTKSENIIATDIRSDRLKRISEKYKVKTTEDNNLAIEKSDILVFCVKPQTIPDVLKKAKASIQEEQLILTIVAGITTDTYNLFIDKKNPVIRAMPNIPAVVRESASAICLGSYAHERHKELAIKIFESVGQVEILDEFLMDAVTGLSGSGPAYIYMVIEALADGGVMMGLPRDVATRLATQTVLGSAKLVRQTEIHPAVLKDQVTTPGGTTILAIKELEAHGLRPMLIRAVETATEKSKQLSEILRANSLK
jgi:pyrroline-5-carboxylate reductase